VGLSAAPSPISGGTRDVAQIAAAIVENLATQPELTVLLENSAAVEELTFLLRVPDGSVAGATAILQALRLATAAATVALASIDERTDVTVDFAASVLERTPIDLHFVDVGQSSFWSSVRVVLRDPRSREVGGALLALIGAGLAIVATVVGAAGGAAIALGIASAVPGTLQAAWALAIRPAEDTIPEKLDTVEATALSARSTIEATSAEVLRLEVTASGWINHILAFRDRLSGSQVEIRRVEVTPPITEHEALLQIDFAGDAALDFARVRELAVDYKLELGDPKITRSVV
jgi:hypothetical protein